MVYKWIKFEIYYLAKRNRVVEDLDSDSDEDVINVQETIEAENRLKEFTARILANNKEEEKQESESEPEEVQQKPKKRKLEEHIDINQVMTKSKV